MRRRGRSLPVELAGRYYKEGADEITFLNITAFRDETLADMPLMEMLQQASEQIFVPLCIGGGIRDYTDKNGQEYTALEVASSYFRAGADKVSLGSDAVRVPPWTPIQRAPSSRLLTVVPHDCWPWTM